MAEVLTDAGFLPLSAPLPISEAKFIAAAFTKSEGIEAKILAVANN